MAESIPLEKCSSLSIGTLNIINAGRSRLNAALRCMREMNMDLGILTETKLYHTKYSKSCEGYLVEATVSERMKGGVALFYKRDPKGWSIESTKHFGPNVIRATLVSGHKHWNIIGAYVPPSESDGKTLDWITQAWLSRPNNRWPTILLGDLNVDLDKLGDGISDGTDRRVQTATLIDSLGLSSLRNHFRQCQRHLGRFWTWYQVRQGVTHGAICDHILTDSKSDFTNCQIRIPRFDTDHYMLKCKMTLVSERSHRRYVGSRKAFPIPKQKPEEMSKADAILAELSEHAQHSRSHDGRQSSWISSETWKLIDQKAEARRTGNAERLRCLKKEVAQSLHKDRKNQCTAVAATIQSFLHLGKIRDAFNSLKGWYRDRGPRPPLPSREDIALTRAEYENLFSQEAPSEDPIPLHIPQFTIDDVPPSENEVVKALSKLRNHRAAGASGLTAEDLKAWHQSARESAEGLEPSQDAVDLWEKVLELIRLIFEDGIIPHKFCHGILVLIPKAQQGEFRGIALLEPLYKLVSMIINDRIQAGITFDDAIHGFRPGRGTGTAIMEAKLLMQLHSRSDKPLYMIFLDLKKAYDTLDRSQAMRILEGYGVGPNLRRIISKVWEGDTMVPRQSGYFGKPFRAHRGVRQGDIMSPLIFNIMVDAVVRHWRHLKQQQNTKESAVFYADDGLLTGTDAALVQDSMDIITKGFSSLGLKMNAAKTEFLVLKGGRSTVRLTSAAYARIITGHGQTHRQKSLEKVQCLKCGSVVNRQGLSKHQLTIKCRKLSATYAPPTPVRERVTREQLITTPLNEECNRYTVSIPTLCSTSVVCPVPNCLFEVGANKPAKRLTMRKHFQTRHMTDMIVITEEGELPQCPNCGFFGDTIGTERHRQSQDCQINTERRKRYFNLLQQSEAVGRVFTVDDTNINRVAQFKYLGRLLDESDNDDHAANRQLQRAREKWNRIGKVLSSQGVNAKTMGYFYKAIVQAVLLYGSESWTLTEGTLKKLRSFHSRVARYLTGRHIRPNADGTWNCPSSSDVLEEAGLCTIDEYIERRRVTVQQFVQDRPIYQQCLRSRALSTNVNKVVWWRL